MAEIMYNIRETAQILAVSEKTISRWIKAGRIEAHRYGATLVRISSLEIERIKRNASNRTEESLTQVR